MKAPRLLVTGFGPFPGAPVNPTERLLTALRDRPEPAGVSAFAAERLDVDYATIAGQLSALGRAFAPDIAIHFGLARECAGFRLERFARNTHRHARPDNSGAMPASARVCDGPDILPSSLPLAAMHEALEAEGLPVEWSDDAGGYLCNTVFTLSRAHACEGLSPGMSGFIHIPPLAGDAPAGSPAMTLDQLIRGAAAIISVAAREWSAARSTAA